MLAPFFDGVEAWVFDLDNTLYPPEMDLFAQIEVRMTDFVMRALGVGQAEANHLRQAYWRDYGTTLGGLMALHDVDPAPYLTEVHEIDLSHLEPDPVLAQEIRSLPGKRIVHTNGCAPYAERVLAARGLQGLFDGVYGVEHAEFQSKPLTQAYESVLTLAAIDPERGAMFEDVPRNLAHPHALGMQTVLVHAREEAPYIAHQTDDLAGFLSQIA